MNRDSTRLNGLARVREELRHEFDHAAETDRSTPRAPSRRVRLFVAMGIVAIAVPGAVAAAGAFDGDDATISVNGDTVSINGQAIDCPAGQDIKDELGLDPCRILTEPAPAPLSERPSSGGSFEQQDASR